MSVFIAAVSPTVRTIRAARVTRAALLLSVSGVLFGGCSWGRFTKLKEDAPVVRLEPSDSYKGQYGLSLAVAARGERTELYVGGAAFDTGGQAYSLGVEGDPQPNPTDEGHCQAEADETCSTIARPLGVDRTESSGEERELCFITGFGEKSTGTGLWARCRGEDASQEFLYSVPSDVEAGLGAPEDRDNPSNLQLATHRGNVDQLVVAGTPAQARAWYYEPLEVNDPIDIETPAGAGSDFGGAVAVARIGGVHVIAVAAPASAEVWLYRAEGGVATPIGCLSGDELFGRTLATGDVNADGDEDLVVADSSVVTVLDGGDLGALTASAFAGSCSDDDVSRDVSSVQIVCTSTDETTGCGASDFGVALTVADINGDGSGLVIVGAPAMAAREVARAGAVLAYKGDGEFVDVLIVSDADEGDLFGTSVAAVPQDGRDIVAAGASGSRKVYLHYCAAGSDGGGSKRCK